MGNHLPLGLMKWDLNLIDKFKIFCCHRPQMVNSNLLQASKDNWAASSIRLRKSLVVLDVLYIVSLSAT